jgi:hypothetical protein
LILSFSVRSYAKDSSAFAAAAPSAKYQRCFIMIDCVAKAGIARNGALRGQAGIGRGNKDRAEDSAGAADRRAELGQPGKKSRARPGEQIRSQGSGPFSRGRRGRRRNASAVAARGPFAALASAPGWNTRLIFPIFFEIARGARKPQSLHQIAGLDAFFEGYPREEKAVGAHLIDRRQAEEGEMDLRQRFFARAPKFSGAANLCEGAASNGFAMGGAQKGNDARLTAIESETARRQPLRTPPAVCRARERRPLG